MLNVAVYICDPNTWEAETGELQVLGQPGLHSEILAQINKQTNNNKKKICG
jgi:hypothetical protein